MDYNERKRLRELLSKKVEIYSKTKSLNKDADKIEDSINRIKAKLRIFYNEELNEDLQFIKNKSI